MAYKRVVSGRSYPHVYNLTVTVGSRKVLSQDGGATMYARLNEPNLRDDVMLVQYFLKRIYERGGLARPALDPSSPSRLLVLDGNYGPHTQTAIDQFQLEMRRNGRSIATDGCVDPERGDSTVGSISHTGYSISWMNKYFSLLYPEYFPDLGLDPGCPPLLASSVADFRV